MELIFNNTLFIFSGVQNAASLLDAPKFYSLDLRHKHIYKHALTHTASLPLPITFNYTDCTPDQVKAFKGVFFKLYKLFFLAFCFLAFDVAQSSLYDNVLGPLLGKMRF